MKASSGSGLWPTRMSMVTGDWSRLPKPSATWQTTAGQPCGFPAGWPRRPPGGEPVSPRRLDPQTNLVTSNVNDRHDDIVADNNTLSRCRDRTSIAAPGRVQASHGSLVIHTESIGADDRGEIAIAERYAGNAAGQGRFYRFCRCFDLPKLGGATGVSERRHD